MSSLLFAVLSLLVSHTLALPARLPGRFSARYNDDELNTNGRRGSVVGTIGLGDNSDLLYTVPIQIEDTTTIVNLDTGSSDLWVITSNCRTNACAKTTGSTVRVPVQSLQTTGANVTMRYGDSTTGTYATGFVAEDTVSIAGVAIQNQLFAAVEDTTNTVVEFGTAGLLGLGFPSESQVQAAEINNQFGSSSTTDHFVASSYDDGPLISRIAQTGALEAPLFSISLQRSTIDISGSGALTLGKLPPGVDNSSITWIPVRLYSFKEGGLAPPTFAPNEVYPLRWEIDLDAVFLDGKQLPASKIPANGGVDTNRMSALIDTGNSILRGPADVVSSILGSISPNYDANTPNSATLSCAKAHNLTFQIGGKMFPIDPRDMIGQVSAHDASNCVADNLVATDPPNVGALFRWSLGAPFLRSNLVVFYYGNLTHPSQDPPRIGILSQVPNNAAQLLANAVQDAVENGGNFDSTLVLAPTLSAEQQPEVTVVGSVAAAEAAALTGNRTPTPTPPPLAPPNQSARPAPEASPVGSTDQDSQDPPQKNSASPRRRNDPWLVALGIAAFTVLTIGY